MEGIVLWLGIQWSTFIEQIIKNIGQQRYLVGISGFLRRPHKDIIVKVAFIQKVLMRSSYLQTDEPNYFPELETLQLDYKIDWNLLKGS